MDSQNAHNAHPAFVEFIRQMTPDEARIISVLDSKSFFPIFEVQAIRSIGSTVVTQARYTFLAEVASCSTPPQLIPSYIDNLQRMGLIKTALKKPEIVSLMSLRNKHWVRFAIYDTAPLQFEIIRIERLLR